MTPRNTKHGASASARRTSSKGSGGASSSRSRSSTTARATSRGAKSAPKKAAKPSTKRAPAKAASAGRWWLIPAMVIAVVVVFAWTYYPVAKVQYRETRERERLASELTQLRTRNDRLRQQVERLKTPEGVEDYARSQLGMVKQGESVAVVVDGNEKQEAAAMNRPADIDSDEATVAPAGPWTAFLDLVFGVQ